MLLWVSCSGQKNITWHLPTVDNNVCKRLTGRVVLYAIFVDSKTTLPWTDYDMSSTLDSIRKAARWMEAQAQKRGTDLSIIVDMHRGKDGVLPISGAFSKRTLSTTLFTPKIWLGIRSVDRWADKVSKTALQSYPPDTATRTLTKVKPGDRERLIARLRDIHKTDNVALLFFINNYYKEEMSVALHTGSFSQPEYAIVSFKKPAVIAHEFMHLFGAIDLYVTPWDSKRKARARKAWAMKEFPNEVMAFTHRNLDSLNVSPITEYMVGWRRELDQHYVDMVLSKRLKIAKY
jgi:hypothetical protein